MSKQLPHDDVPLCATPDELGRFSRRTLIAQGAILALLPLGCPPKPPQPPQPPQPPPVPVTRRNIATLAAGDATLLAFREAVKKMKALPASDPRNWQRQASIHDNFCPHQNWLFLPWHRAYLYYFEQICKELSGDESFALPYWNWTLNKQIPSAFWDDPANNSLFHPGRVATPASTTGPSTNEATITSILVEPNFQLLASGSIPLAASQRTRSVYGPLEGTPHNYVHGFVGGDMATFLSPLDPIFWCHHNMIEAIWYEWSIVRHNANASNADWTDRTFTEFCDRHGQPVSIKVSDMLLWPVDAYQFDPLVLSTSPTARPAERPAQGDVAALRELVRRGAPSELALSGLSVLARGSAIPLNQALSLTAAAASNVRRVGPSRPLVRLSDVTPVATGQILGRVFVNKPDASASTSTDIPQYLGTIAFFSHAHGPTPEPVSFLLNATRALGEGEAVTSVQVVPVPFDGRSTNVPRLDIDRIELGVL